MSDEQPPPYHLSSYDRECIDGIRSELAKELEAVPAYADDFSILRWLHAWDYDIETILPKFKYTLTTLRALNLHDADFSSLLKIRDHMAKHGCPAMEYYPGTIMGTDKAGNIVIIEPQGLVDPKGLMYSGPTMGMLRHQIMGSEAIMTLLREQEKKRGRKLGVVIITDLEGFGMDQVYMPALKAYMLAIQTLQELFPDCLAKIYIINHPKIIGLVYNIIKPAVAKQTREKIEFLGDDWKTRLRQVIDEEELFPYWGGKKKYNNSPYGWIRMCGPVPKELRYKPENNPLEPIDDEELTKISVPARSSRTIPITVNNANAKLSWYWKLTSGSDIRFEVKLSDGTIIRPNFRVITEFVPEFDTVDCPYIGTYNLIFDNSEGKIWAKHLCYKVVVTE